MGLLSGGGGGGERGTNYKGEPGPESVQVEESFLAGETEGQAPHTPRHVIRPQCFLIKRAPLVPVATTWFLWGHGVAAGLITCPSHPSGCLLPNLLLRLWKKEQATTSP